MASLRDLGLNENQMQLARDLYGDPEQLQLQDFVPGLGTAREGDLALRRGREALNAETPIRAALRSSEALGHGVAAGLDLLPGGGAAVKLGLAGLGTITPVLKHTRFGPSLDPSVSPQMLDVFKDMKAKGYTPKQIAKETGIYEDMGRLMTQFPDHKASPKLGFFDTVTRAQQRGEARAMLGDVYEHDELFKRYPEIADRTVVTVDSTPGKTGGSVAVKLKEDGSLASANIRINTGDMDSYLRGYGLESDVDGYKNIMTHEIQHIVQSLEDLPRGTNARAIKDMMQPAAIKRKLLEKRALERQLDLVKNPDSKQAKKLREAITDIDEHVSLMGAIKDVQDKNGLEQGDIAKIIYTYTRGEQDARWAAFMAKNPDVAEELPTHLLEGAKKHVGFGGRLTTMEDYVPSMVVRGEDRKLSMASGLPEDPTARKVAMQFIRSTPPQKGVPDTLKSYGVDSEIIDEITSSVITRDGKFLPSNVDIYLMGAENIKKSYESSIRNSQKLLENMSDPALRKHIEESLQKYQSKLQSFDNRIEALNALKEIYAK